jgi:RNA polymerase sigma factor (sigma-70 family)
MNYVADEVLVRRVAQSSDERAMSELYDRYAGLINGAGVRYLGDRGLAEDLVQDVFTAMWRGAGGFEPRRASFATWVYRITRNRATDLIRRRRARVRIVGAMRPSSPGRRIRQASSRGTSIWPRPFRGSRWCIGRC